MIGGLAQGSEPVETEDGEPAREESPTKRCTARFVRR